MIVFFVARAGSNDSDEFARYEKGLATRAKSYVPVRPMSNRVRESDGRPDVNRPKKSYADMNNAAHRDSQAPIKYCDASAGKDHVVVVDVTERKDAIKKILCRRIADEKNGILSEADDTTIKDVTAFLETFLKLASVVNASNPVFASDICILIHWGDGSPFEFEKQFRALIEKTEFQGLRSYAISTRRPECFDVRGTGEIVVPRDSVSLSDLICRFTYHTFKDALTQCIWWWMGTSTVDRHVAVSANEFDSMNDYFDHWYQHLKTVGAREDRWRVSALRLWQEEFKGRRNRPDAAQSSSHVAISYRSEFVALFSDLIGKGGVYV